MTSESDMAPEVGDAVAEVLRAAYYYALLDGHRSVEPRLLLVAAARNDDTLAGPVLGAAVAEARSRFAPNGGDSAPAILQQRQYGATLREAGWWVYRGADQDKRAQAERTGGSPTWTSELCTALDRAARAAEVVGATRLGVSHLLVGLLDTPDQSLQSLLTSLKLDPAALTKEVRARQPATAPRPFTPVVDLMAPFGAIEERNRWFVRWIPAVVARLTSHDRRWGGPLLAGLEMEILRQAVRSGHSQVQTSDVILAGISLDDQLHAAGRRLRQPYVAHNQAGRVLAEVGISLPRALRVAEGLTERGEVVPIERSAKRFWGSGKPGDPAWGQAAAHVMDWAGTMARRLHHDDIGTSHLLAAALDQEDSSAVRLVAELGGERGLIRQRLSEHLSA